MRPTPRPRLPPRLRRLLPRRQGPRPGLLILSPRQGSVCNPPGSPFGLRQRRGAPHSPLREGGGGRAWRSAPGGGDARECPWGSELRRKPLALTSSRRDVCGRALRVRALPRRREEGRGLLFFQFASPASPPPPPFLSPRVEEPQPSTFSLRHLDEGGGGARGGNCSGLRSSLSSAFPPPSTRRRPEAHPPPPSLPRPRLPLPP